MKRASLNHTYRLVWRDATQAFVAVAENSKACGKKSRAGRALAATVGAFLMSGVHAAVLPTGGVVTGGSGNISQSGSVMTITQASTKLAADWQTFSIGQGNTVNFVQPSVSAVALNRVLGADVSVIQGALNANGQVFIINPNGVLFTPTAQVNVGGLVASTLGMSTADFMAGNYKFEGGSSNAIINQGNITAANGGTIALIAAKITNAGTLTANRGNVLLGAGSKVTLDLGGPVKLQVEQGAIDALIESGGAIKSDGGTVLLTAKAAGDLAASVINHTGIIEAQTLSSGEKGQIYLIGGMDKDRIVVGGKLDASAPNGGDGGFIETSAAKVNIADDAHITTLAPCGNTGTWLIDPNDYTVASSGGNITGAALASSLNSTNVTIATATQGTAGGNGDIFINDTVTKTGSSAATLTLLADRSIAINAPITSSSGRLNVTLTADNLNAGTGDVSFGAAGRVETNGGNFYVGSVSGSYDTVAAKGQAFTMATGSYVNIGNGGSIEVSVNGNVTLPNNSAQATTYGFSAPTYTTRYFNNGTYAGNYGYVSQIKLTSASGSITSANTNAAIADIVTAVDTYLSAGTIGSAGTPIRISGPADLLGLIANPTYSTNSFPNVAKTLYTTNTAGSSYINEIGTQVFKTVYLTVGSQTSSTQNVQIMGDAGGNGTTGTGHIILNTDGAGLLNVATGNIKTAGLPGTSNPNTDPQIWPTSVTVNAPNITFANNSVDTGSVVPYYLYPGSYYSSYWGYSYYASFVASASGTLSSVLVDGTWDIKSYSTTLNAVNIGTPTNPVELGAGAYLYVNNTGGSTYIKSVGNDFSQLYLTNVKTSGTHSILFSGGDHINYTTNASGIILPTITGGNSDGSTFGATTGIDVHNSNRSITLTANSGYVEFDTNSVNTGSGNFTTSIYYNNIDRNAGKAIYAKNAKDAAAEITAGNAYFNIYNSTLGHISDIEIAQGTGATNNTLTINTYQGNVDVTELTENHFKSLNVTLNGASLAQTVAIALAGPDDVNFSDSGSLVTIDATKVNLSSNNRNWNLQASGRTIEVDGVSLGTGNYTLYGGSGLKLNSDVMTNGGNISLTGGGSTGIALMRSLRIDSNADDINNSASTGSAGSISLSGTISGVTSGYALTVDSGSTTTSGSTISMYSGAGNGAGAYLSGLTLTSKGSTDTNDGTIYLYSSSYLLNGNFLSTGYSYLQNYVTIDTEQGNVASGGNITFAGRDLYFYPYYSQTFNTSTTAAGCNAGNVDLYGTFYHSTLSAGGGLTVTATSGAGGTAGNISLPAVSSTYEGYSNTQSYTGGIITLYGNLSTNRGSVTLAGDTRLAGNITIDTWSSASASYPSGTAGSVTISGTGVSATAAGRTLTVNTGTNTGANDKNTSNDANSDPAIAHPSSEYWSHNGGSVNIKAGNTGGEYLGTLTITTTKGGTYNNGSNGAITINDVRTTGNQTYTGGSTVVAGNVTSGSTVTLNTVTDGATVSGSGVITASSLLLNGLNTAYNLNDGTGHKVGILAATGASNFNFLNDDVALAIGTVSSVNGISASGLIDIATNSGDITISQNVATTDVTNTAITINAGKSAAAGTATGGSIIVSGTPTITSGTGGRATLYTGSVSGSTGLTALIGSGSGRFRYNSDEAASNYSAALGSGTYAIYRERPALTVTPTAASSTYGDAVSVAAVTGAVGGYVNGDDATTAGVSGTASFSTAATSNSHAGTYDIVYASGLANTVGYAIADTTGSTGEYSITARTLIATLSNTGVTKTYDGTTASNLVPTYAFSGLASVDTAATLSNTGAVYDSVNVANATKVTVSGLTISSITGNGLASDYMLDATSKDIAATITKVRLLYVADAATMSAGTTVPAVSGTATGFVAGENAANATSGTLAFNTPATSSSSAGQYAINGSGLTAANYDFSQAAGNATALTIGATLLPPQAAIQVVQTAAAPVVIAQTMPLTVPLNTGGAMIGGLEMIPVKSDTLAGETIMPTKGDVGSDTPVLAQVGEQQGGTDIMKVFVVNGGVNLPSAAQTQQQEQQEGR